MLIFTVTNKITSQVYVGTTRNQLEVQWAKIVAAAEMDLDFPLYKEILRYGADEFSVEEWDYAESRDELAELEQEAINTYSALSLKGYKLGSSSNTICRPVRRKAPAKAKPSNPDTSSTGAQQAATAKQQAPVPAKPPSPSAETMAKIEAHEGPSILQRLTAKAKSYDAYTHHNGRSTTEATTVPPSKNNTATCSPAPLPEAAPAARTTTKAKKSAVQPLKTTSVQTQNKPTAEEEQTSTVGSILKQLTEQAKTYNNHSKADDNQENSKETQLSSLATLEQHQAEDISPPEPKPLTEKELQMVAAIEAQRDLTKQKTPAEMESSKQSLLAILENLNEMAEQLKAQYLRPQSCWHTLKQTA
ncbi:GIY-YIG nuclease family protein [Zooshikella harenae]|uniref:GIY-YIG nuclease family protein n=1 Tax=Zooshikella harenae TaxID=2827238 RepID=A0ABS5Z7Z7_9GAMM|nr:GIY-YIG nuclease family protein [Zooshikella harenae]MBU2710129.1 GIY-YIG nuclease family protein [Zooshikella harenae]